MFGLTDFRIDFLSNLTLPIILACLILLALAVLLYYRTNPPLPRWMRVGLGVIRGLAILLIIAALLEPVFSFSRERTRERRVSVLVDNSLSMDHEDDGSTRAARVDSLLDAPAFGRLASNAEVSLWYFGDSLAKSPDAVGRERSALGDALAGLDKAELASPADYWLVLSDGNSNSGRVPAEVVGGSHTPVYCVGMAGGGGGLDVALADVEYNPVAFVGRPSEVKVRIKLQQAAGQTVRVQLAENGRVLFEQSMSVTENGGFGELDLRYTPDQPGQHLVKIQVPLLDGEASEGNNSRTVAIKALKSRVKVLLVAEQPDYETGFLHRYLRQSERYDVTLIATGNRSGNLGGSLPTSQAEFNQYDLVILQDPTPTDLSPHQRQLRSYLAERGGGLWILYGPRLASAGPAPWLDSLLPMTLPNPLPPRYRDFQLVPAEGQLFHPAIRLADDRASIREFWSQLPPSTVLVPCEDLTPNSTVLAFAAGPGIPDGRYIALAQKRVGPGKVLAGAALPYWTWGFKPLAFQADNSGYRKFIEGALSWLTVQDDFDPIRIVPTKNVFSRGEAARFEAFAFDQGFRPIPEVSGVVKLTGEADEHFEQDLLAVGEGTYRAEFEALPPGTYSYEATLTKDGAQIKRQTGQVLVESFSLEEFDQQGQPSTLMALARASGGTYVDYPQFDQVTAGMDLSPVAETLSGEYVLWGKLWVLLGFIGLLAVEWIVRKSQHLI